MQHTEVGGEKTLSYHKKIHSAKSSVCRVQLVYMCSIVCIAGIVQQNIAMVWCLQQGNGKKKKKKKSIPTSKLLIKQMMRQTKHSHTFSV